MKAWCLALRRTWRISRKALWRYYTLPQETQFKSLRNGFIVFTFGLAIVLIANSTVPPSIEQEAAVLAGLTMGGVGFILAMRAYIRIIISRIIIFFTEK